MNDDKSPIPLYKKEELNITITDNARAHIQTFTEPLGKQAGFRLLVKKSGCSGFSYVPKIATEPQPNDICVVANGVNVFTDEPSVHILHGITVDVLHKEFGQKQLVFNNPQAEAHCGCGESFTLKEKE